MPPDLVICIVESDDDELVVDHCHMLQGIGALSNQRLPGIALGVCDVNRDDFASGSVEVRSKVEHRTRVPQELVTRLQDIDELREGIAAQAFVHDAVTLIGPLRDVQDKVSAIIRDNGAETPPRLVRPAVDEHVFCLVGPQAMQVDLLVVVRAGILCALLGCLIAPIEEPSAVRQPRTLRKLAPANHLREVLTRFNSANVPGPPVGAADAGGIGNIASVAAHRQTG